ncbi:MAG: hypothetical protein WB716_13790, partial [Candidatus Acidiferrales bacterium]
MVGWVEFGTEKPTSVAAGQYGSLAVPQGTITAVNSATSITVSNAATENCNGASPPSGLNCTLTWSAADDATPLQNAFNAAWVNSPNACLPVKMEFAGAILVGDPPHGIITLSAPCTASTDADQQGPEWDGLGSGSTKIIPTPNFVWADCSGGCFPDVAGISMRGMEFDGEGQPVNTSEPVVIISVISGQGCSAGSADDIKGSQFALQSGAVGFAFNSCGGHANDITMENFGSTQIEAVGSSSYSANWAQMNDIVGFGGY